MFTNGCAQTVVMPLDGKKRPQHMHFASTSKWFKTYNSFNVTYQVFYLPENFIFFAISFLITCQPLEKKMAAVQLTTIPCANQILKYHSHIVSDLFGYVVVQILPLDQNFLNQYKIFEPVQFF